jgi:hypothetical protein
MSTHPSQTFPGSAADFGFNFKSCPTCDQEIPPDRIAEIGGRIAAREQERTVAITSQLEERYIAERERADAAARADLEAERAQGAMREARARDEAQRAAETLFDRKIVEVEQGQAAQLAQVREQLAEAESARKAAEQTWANLQAEINEVRANSATAIEEIRTEAKRRENEIRDEAKCSAELATAERVAAMETARRDAEASLNARLTEAETARVTAEQSLTSLASELGTVRNSASAELVRVKEAAAAELLRVQATAAEEVETRFRDDLKASEAALAEAQAKAVEAETAISALRDQHTVTMEANLKEQREVMEKATAEAVNAEKSRAFEENQKLADKVTDLQRALEKKTADELGEGAEVNLYEDLKKEFPDDDIKRVSKGTQGADILHVVVHSGKKCGTIIYDSKNRNKFQWDYVTKLRDDQLAAEAEHAILSTRKFPEGTRQLHLHDGVLLANPARVVIVAKMIRQHMLRLHTQQMGDVERKAKTGALYDFIVSERCSSVLARIDERAEHLLEEQAKEIKWHENHWKKEGETIRAIEKAKADLENQISRIIGTSAESEAA